MQSGSEVVSELSPTSPDLGGKPRETSMKLAGTLPSVKIPDFLFSFLLPSSNMISLIIKEFPLIFYDVILLEYVFLSDSLFGSFVLKPTIMHQLYKLASILEQHNAYFCTCLDCTQRKHLLLPSTAFPHQRNNHRVSFEASS